jgi:hypothetical protein
MTPIEQIEHDLRTGAARAITPATARAYQLAPWAYFTAEADAPLRLQCASDYAAAWSRFQLQRQRLCELLAAWQAAAIDPTLFKGFAIALQAYPNPVLRFFHDVDVYVEPRDVQRAIAALPAGWCIDSVLRADHEVGSIRSPDEVLAVDLHCSFFPWSTSRSRRAARRTAALLSERETVSIDGLQLCCLQPVDAALIGIAINRGWGDDRWRPKPHDYLDLTYLRENCGVRADALLARAAALGLLRSWHAYARACNPDTATLDLRHIARSVRLRNDLAMFADGSVPTYLRRLGRAPIALLEVVQVLPTLFAACSLLRRSDDYAALVQALIRSAPPLDRGYNAVRAVRWAMRLFAPYWLLARVEPPLLALLSLFILLARQAHSVELLRGIPLDAEAQSAHNLWIESNGRPLRAFDCESIATHHRPDLRIRPPLL